MLTRNRASLKTVYQKLLSKGHRRARIGDGGDESSGSDSDSGESDEEDQRIFVSEQRRVRYVVDQSTIGITQRRRLMGIYQRRVKGCRLSEKVLLTKPVLALQTTTQLVIRWQTESTSVADAKRVVRYEVQWRHVEEDAGGSIGRPRTHSSPLLASSPSGGNGGGSEKMPSGSESHDDDKGEQEDELKMEDMLEAWSTFQTKKKRRRRNSKADSGRGGFAGGRGRKQAKTLRFGVFNCRSDCF